MLTMTINGAAVGGATTFDVVNPATGRVAAQAPDCSPEQLDAALAAAAAAGPAWRSDVDERRKAMLRLAEALTAAGDAITADLILETGKPAPVAASEVPICGMWLQVFADMEIPRRVLQDDASALIEVAYRPLGVVAAITPWNFPIGLAMWKIAPALLAGNTIVLKPSPFTPLATLRMGQIMGEVLPPGVVNVVTGGDDLGRALSAHPTPRKITFTGSVAGGKSVAAAAGADLKRVTLELGGNDAVILMADADLAAAVPKILGTAFFNTGQACALPKRIFVPDALYDEAVDAFAAGASAIEVGPPENATTQMGPLSTRPQFERVTALAAEAIAGGARVAAGGGPVDGEGFFFRPTILADVPDTARVVAEEQFGPVLPILRYSAIDDAVERANSTMFGLCGSVWGTDIGAAGAVAERLECGTTFVNTHAALLPTVPFGGSKWSGVGVENGVDGLLAFTEPQVVHTARA
ncbi:aldehyde dehydrogenase family protein [Pseudonocardia sp. GCM10023141]|uniref:aldehyde dehydrogenase family protein n=1 Tax=Pseudonocardia sp. GCM10023141 TaxID=3252653 RepID=UPI00361CB365